jgi:hypothetical protein
MNIKNIKKFINEEYGLKDFLKSLALGATLAIGHNNYDNYKANNKFYDFINNYDYKISKSESNEIDNIKGDIINYIVYI